MTREKKCVGGILPRRAARLPFAAKKATSGAEVAHDDACGVQAADHAAAHLGGDAGGAAVGALCGRRGSPGCPSYPGRPRSSSLPNRERLFRRRPRLPPCSASASPASTASPTHGRRGGTAGRCACWRPSQTFLIMGEAVRFLPHSLALACAVGAAGPPLILRLMPPMPEDRPSNRPRRAWLLPVQMALGGLAVWALTTASAGARGGVERSPDGLSGHGFGHDALCPRLRRPARRHAHPAQADGGLYRRLLLYDLYRLPARTPRAAAVLRTGNSRLARNELCRVADLLAENAPHRGRDREANGRDGSVEIAEGFPVLLLGMVVEDRNARHPQC